MCSTRVADTDVGGMQRARLAAEEAFGQIAGVPEVEVADLRPLDADDAKEMPLGHPKAAPFPRRDDGLADLRQILPRCIQQAEVGRRKRFDRISQDRALAASRGSVRRHGHR